MNDRQTRSGANILLEVLESEKVEYIFGNPGTTELPLMDALINKPNIHYVWGLQESSVVAMADGYAQASGKPGFINLHTSGGLGHGLGNLINARTSGTPLVVTAGQQDSRHAITDPLLQGDLTSLASPSTKWAIEVTNPNQLPVLIHRAFQDCQDSNPGPVFLSLPMDVMENHSDISIMERSNVDRRPVANSLPELAKELSAIAAGRIAIIAGDEISKHDSYKEVVELAEILAAPVFGSSWPAHIPYPTSHYLWQGNLPTRAEDIANIMKDFDCVFALGGKSFITVLYSEASALPENCELFQLSVDGRDLGRTYPTKLSLVGDIQLSLQEINRLLKDILLYQQDSAQKNSAQQDKYEVVRENSKANFIQKRKELNLKADALMNNAKIHPMVAARELAISIGSTPIIDEALATSIHIRKFLNNSGTRQYSMLRGGALGWGMPAAVGFSLGIDRKPVVSLVGDGAAMYSPQAIWTAMNEELPVTFIVMNNREYNILKNFMRSQPHYNAAKTGKFIAMDINKPTIDFQALAKSMGMPSQFIDNASDIQDAVKKSISSGRPNLIEIMIDTE